MPQPLRLAYLGFALLGAGVLGAFVYDRTRPHEPVTGVRARPTATSAAGIRLPTVPSRRPDITLKDLDGRTRSLAEWNGKALVINFWATWCAPCRREIPLFNRIEAESSSKGVEVVGIAVDFAEDVKAFTRDVPIRYPLLIGEEDGLAAARAFGVETLAFPFTAFTDSAGRIIAIHMGELREPQAWAILGIVARVDAGALTPAEAKDAVEAALAAIPEPPRHAGTPAAG